MKQIQILGEFVDTMPSIFTDTDPFEILITCEVKTLFFPENIVDHIASSENPLAAYLRSVWVSFDGDVAPPHTREVLSFVHRIEHEVSGTIHINVIDRHPIKSKLNS